MMSVVVAHITDHIVPWRNTPRAFINLQITKPLMAIKQFNCMVCHVFSCSHALQYHSTNVQFVTAVFV
jgi:hypothetical protein